MTTHATDITYYAIVHENGNDERLALGINTFDGKCRSHVCYKDAYIYYTTFEHIAAYITSSCENRYYGKIVVLQLCNDSQVYDVPSILSCIDKEYVTLSCAEKVNIRDHFAKYKTNKCNILKIFNVFDFVDNHVIKFVKQNCSIFKFVKNKTPKICMIALQQNRYTTYYVAQFSDNPTENVITRCSGYALGHIEKQTHELCMMAMQRDRYSLDRVKKQTYELCMVAVRYNYVELNYAKNQPSKLCMTAVRTCEFALAFVKNQTLEQCMEAIRQDGRSLYYVKDQTFDIALVAMQYDKSALQYVKDKNLRICLMNLMDVAILLKR